MICRQTRESLSESILVTYEQEIVTADGYDYLAQGPQRSHRQRYVYPNGSEIILGCLEKPTKVLSTSWDIIYVNEAIETKEDAWEMLASRLNRPGRTRCGWLIGDTNPGHPSHWIKRRGDNGKTALWNSVHEANPQLFDRRGWSHLGRKYLSTLDGLSGARLQRLRYGLWAAADGLVYPHFGSTVVPVSACDGIRGRAVGGMDFGFNNPFAANWGVLDSDDVLWITGEYYRSKQTLPEVALALPRNGTRFYADPARPDSIVELRHAGFDVAPCVHLGARPIMEGIDRVSARIAEGRLKISEACTDLIRESTIYAYDPEKLTEQPIDSDNHAMDALRYLITGIDRGKAVPQPKPDLAAILAEQEWEEKQRHEEWQSVDNPAWWGEEEEEYGD